MGNGTTYDSLYDFLCRRAKSISRAFPSATYTNTKENSEKDALDKQQGEKAGTGRLRRESLELVTCSSDFLTDAYNPKPTLDKTSKK